jgi:hypothetical protein
VRDAFPLAELGMTRRWATDPVRRPDRAVACRAAKLAADPLISVALAKVLPSEAEWVDWVDRSYLNALIRIFVSQLSV